MISKLRDPLEISEYAEKYGSAGYTNEEVIALCNRLAELEKRAEAAEAKLEQAGEGINPVFGYADSYRSMAKAGVTDIPIWSVITDLERNIAPLFTRPAPAADLADLVPDEMTFDEAVWSCREKTGIVAKSFQVGWNACLAAIPRNIEEAK